VKGNTMKLIFSLDSIDPYPFILNKVKPPKEKENPSKIFQLNLQLRKKGL
jgi:hypothetical protein